VRYLPLLITLACLGASRGALAECECLWQGSFVEVQAGTDLVVSGRVTRGKGNSIDLAIERQLRGGTDETEIRIWLKTADYCRPEPELFPSGSEWVMALSRIEGDVPGGFNPNTPNISYGRPGDYSLSSCGGYWLRRSGDWVTGNLVQAPRWERDPKMTPVLLDLLAAFLEGEVDADAIASASREDPAARQLILDTKAFLREKN